MSPLEKLNLLVSNNEIMTEFVYFSHETPTKSCCDVGEEHKRTWYDGACRARKSVKSIEELFDRDASIDQKKIVLLMCSLTHKDTFDYLFRHFEHKETAFGILFIVFCLFVGR